MGAPAADHEQCRRHVDVVGTQFPFPFPFPLHHTLTRILSRMMAIEDAGDHSAQHFLSQMVILLTIVIPLTAAYCSFVCRNLTRKQSGYVYTRVLRSSVTNCVETMLWMKHGARGSENQGRK